MKDKRRSPIAMEGSNPQPGHWPVIIEPTPVADQKVYPGEGMILVEDDKR
ncbi:hypothetical protein ACFL7M_06305 [Thermodesulfobacteriota bacterium]